MRQRSILILAHVAGWLLFFSLINGFVFRDTGQQEILKNLLSASFLAFCFVYLFVFYFNAYFLFPVLYLRKKPVFYCSTIILLFILVFWMRPFDQLMRNHNGQSPAGLQQLQDERPPLQHQIGPPPRGQNPAGQSPASQAGSGQLSPEQQPPGPLRSGQLPHGQPLRGQPPPGMLGPAGKNKIPVDVTGIVLFIAAWSLSTAICVARQWRLIEQRAIRAEADKANAELSFLKMQINPHFLFNTLNNIYMLAIIKDDNTAPAILKLSNMMRYLTDEVQEDLVPLNSEVECVQDYIDLQRLRLNKNTRIDLAIEGDIAGKQIAPLILMTFVENTFKHGISNREPSEIIIRLLVTPETISFSCRNKLFETKRNTERIGIGMSNAKQRLQHMYPEKHSLTIKAEQGLYSVQLILHA